MKRNEESPNVVPTPHTNYSTILLFPYTDNYGQYLSKDFELVNFNNVSQL